MSGRVESSCPSFTYVGPIALRSSTNSSGVGSKSVASSCSNSSRVLASDIKILLFQYLRTNVKKRTYLSYFLGNKLIVTFRFLVGYSELNIGKCLWLFLNLI